MAVMIMQPLGDLLASLELVPRKFVQLAVKLEGLAPQQVTSCSYLLLLLVTPSSHKRKSFWILTRFPECNFDHSFLL